MAFLIDKYLSEYTFNERHKKLIFAEVKSCFLAAKEIDMTKSFITKTLMRLRGLETENLKMQAFLNNMCFKYVEEKPYEEFVIDASQHHIKIFLNFYFESIESNKTLVSTETRILCLTKKGKFWFSLYWFFIQPFSGITRLEMLRLIKKKAESKK